MKRGRRSAGDLSVVRLTSARIAPPDWLSEPECAEWRAIVNSLEPSYFRPSDIPLLAAYCTASALFKTARQMILDEGSVIELDNGKKQMHPAVTVQQYQSGTMAQLAVKLRLSPSTRYTDKTAATKAGRAALPAAKPWESEQSA